MTQEEYDALVELNRKFDKILPIKTLKTHVDGLLRLSVAMTKLINEEIKPDGEWDEDIVKMFIEPDEILLGEVMINSINSIIEAIQPLALINNLSSIVIDEEV